MQRKCRELDRLTKRATSLGLDPDTIRKKYGVATIQKMCSELGVPDAYEGSYAWYCQFAHNRSQVMHVFSKVVGNEFIFELGPQPDEKWLVVAAHAMQHLAQAAIEAARFVEDRTLLEEAVTLAVEVDAIAQSADADNRGGDGDSIPVG